MLYISPNCPLRIGSFHESLTNVLNSYARKNGLANNLSATIKADKVENKQYLRCCKLHHPSKKDKI